MGCLKMSRCIIKFKNGEHVNVPADCIDLRDGWILAWRGDFIVVIVNASEVIACYLSDKKEG